uniref:Uncharacterized protein n=1 Tax=Arundo donax TaxID=35708 RepID=A0A0A8YKK4_ARUDO
MLSALFTQQVDWLSSVVRPYDLQKSREELIKGDACVWLRSASSRISRN